MVHFKRVILATILLLPAAQASAEDFVCQYNWVTGKKSGLGKNATVRIAGDKARWTWSLFKDASRPELGMQDQTLEYQVLENSNVAMVAGHAGAYAADGDAPGMEVLVLNKTDGLLRMGQVRSDDVFSNLVARCDRK
jgi:hypothetical protein